MNRTLSGMILLFLVLLSACKGGKESSNITSGVPNNNNPTPSTSKNISEAPFVINAVPAQDAVDVGLGSGVKVTFSAPMDAKTITPNTFQLRLGNGVVPAMITIRRTVATLIPSSPLVAGKIYEATVKKIVKDTNGKSLEESYTWNFTTVPMARNLWHGIKQFGPAGEGDSQVSIAKDIDGNIFVTGTTIGNLDDDLHPNAGESDIFLAKYNSSGVKQWVKQIGTDSWDTGEGVAVAADGNIFVTGMTGGSLDDDRHPNVGDYDIFLAKYNSSGAKQWIKQIGTNGEDSGKGVAIDADGNIFMSGTTGGSLDDDHHPNAGHGDIFLAKYNSSGAKQWVKQIGTDKYDAGRGVAVAADGNIFVSGTTEGNLDDDLHPNAGRDDIFLAKYNSSGAKQWVKQIGTNGEDWCVGVAVAADGNIFVTGGTGGSLDDDRHPNAGGYDIFLAKYNSSGAKQWVKQIGADKYDAGGGVAVAADGNIFVTGITDGNLDDDRHPNAGGYDIFLAKYNSSGAKQWVKQIGTNGEDSGDGVAVTVDGNIFVTGGTSGNLDGAHPDTGRGAVIIKFNSSGIVL